MSFHCMFWVASQSHILNHPQESWNTERDAVDLCLSIELIIFSLDQANSIFRCVAAVFKIC